MAWLFKFKNSANWYVGYRLNGRVISKTTRTPDEKEARKQLHKVEAMLDAHSDGDAVDGLYRVLKSQGASQQWSLKSELDDWVLEATKSLAPATADRYRIIAEGLANFLHATDERPLLSKVGTGQISSYLSHVYDKKSPTTANFERKALRGFFRRAITNRRLEIDPHGPNPGIPLA